MANEGGTPGVYVNELSAFPASVVGVATAVPVFIGYTEFAGDPATGAPLYGKPVPIQSQADYATCFGGAAPMPGFALWQQIQLFYDNGGASCFIVSAGSYWQGQSPIFAPAAIPDGWTPASLDANALLAGIVVAGAQAGVTMTVVPEACQLDAAGYAAVAQAMLTQAGTLQDRMAILDLPGCLSATSYADLLAAQSSFWTAIAPAAAYAAFGAAYAPALLLPDNVTTVAPSGALAGLWTQNDAGRGVWNSPANLAIAGVGDPAYKVSDDQQAGFNMPANGMAIDIIRAMPTQGTLVWGARTLEGNSDDYRYIQVRRTLVYIEQSIKAALQQFVFAPNDATTWSAVTAMVSNFLTGLWQAGGLQGPSASAAFSVQCGLGTTMTNQDVLDGYLIVSVKVAITHPAEFIVLTITQQMSNTGN